MDDQSRKTVKIKTKHGHEALIFEESWPAYEAQGSWTLLKDTKPLDEDNPQPLQSALVDGLPEKNTAKK